MRLARMTAPALLIIAAVPALAHEGHGGGLAGGLLHPLSGADHLLAMISIGLFAAMRGGRALWAWPLAFVGAGAAGFVACRNGLVVPLAELMALASVLALGLLVAAAVRVNFSVGLALVAVFGVCHGQAHASEAGSQAIAAFAAGFLVTSAALHVAGLSLYRIVGRRWGRMAGAATLLGGLGLAFV
jgi:urease accessory protein